MSERVTNAFGRVTPEWVDNKLAEIEAAKLDPEKAHAIEDDLYKAILLGIAYGQIDDPIRCCHRALKSAKIEFPRWAA